LNLVGSSLTSPTCACIRYTEITHSIIARPPSAGDFGRVTHHENPLSGLQRHDFLQRWGFYRQRISSHLMSSSIMLDTGPKATGKSCVKLEVCVARLLCIMSEGWPRSVWVGASGIPRQTSISTVRSAFFQICSYRVDYCHASRCVLSNHAWHAAVWRR